MSITTTEIAPAYIRAGRILSGLVIAFLALDAGMKLIPLQPVIDSMRELGFPDTPDVARGLGALLFVCTLLYAFPRTAFIGAVLLTGYLGGAIAAHLRLGNPWLSHVLFGAYIGVATWAGLLARRPDLRKLIIL
jgi:hypothetical protein